jgi:MoxR-like ATPase
MAELIFINGPFQGQRLELSGDCINLGRHPDCNVNIEDAAVSTFHSQIKPDESGWAIFDLKSANGTFVNDQRIEAAHLKHGDTVKIGEIMLQFVGQTGATVHTDVPEATADDLALVHAMGQRAGLIRQEVGKVIVGQFNVVEEILMAMIGGGHALLIGMPGMAKTLMVSTIAKVFNLEFRRVQFTPDLMPSDITGTEILETNRETGEREFRFIRGPLFCNLLLADEINRTPPKTQAALLEAMQEHRVTVGNQTYSLGEPFFVLATQNPIEQEGTYPLPEAQLDRFMFNIWVDYPSAEEEEIIVEATTKSSRAKAQPILTKEEVLQLQEVVRKIPVSKHVIKYATSLVRSTRPSAPEAPDFVKEYISTGAGPRASQVMIMAAKARAVMEGRIHVSCSDIRKAALPVLRHRILTNFAADSEGLTSVHLVERLLKAIPEPTDKDYPSAPVAAHAPIPVKAGKKR